MINQLASIGGCQSQVHFPQKPFVVVNKAPYCLLHKRLGVTAALGSKAGEFGLQVWGELYLHWPLTIAHSEGAQSALLCLLPAAFRAYDAEAV